MATAFMVRYDEEGGTVADWVKLSNRSQTLKDQLWEYSQTLNGGLTILHDRGQGASTKYEGYPHTVCCRL